MPALSAGRIFRYSPIVPDQFLYLVRHGEARPPDGIDDGHSGLTSHGRASMRKIGRLLAEQSEPVDAIYCSPLVRAVQLEVIPAIPTTHCGCFTTFLEDGACVRC